MWSSIVTSLCSVSTERSGFESTRYNGSMSSQVQTKKKRNHLHPASASVLGGDQVLKYGSNEIKAVRLIDASQWGHAARAQEKKRGRGWR